MCNADHFVSTPNSLTYHKFITESYHITVYVTIGKPVAFQIITPDQKTTKVFIQENVFEYDIYKIIKYIFKIKWNLHEDAIIAMQENEFEIVAYKTALILCGLEYINCVSDEIAAID